MKVRNNVDILQTLQDLNAQFGPSGEEEAIRKRIEEIACGRIDETHVDALGNLILRRKGGGPKVMFAAHMDSIGLIVTHIEKEGFLRFGNIGGFIAENILHATVRFKNGTKGTIIPDQSADRAKLTLNDLYVDIGAKDESHASSLVDIGDTAVYEASVSETGDRVISAYLDNRISCVALLSAMQMLDEQNSDTQNDLYFVFTAQEEPGLRGARPAAYAIDPDYCIVCDVTPADDQPGTKHYGSTKLGGGAAIKIMDTSVICHPEMVSRLRTLAIENGIAFQNDVIQRGGTDAGPMHTTRAGVLTGGISVPTRYIHTPQEMADKCDVLSCAKLIAAFAGSHLDKVR